MSADLEILQKWLSGLGQDYSLNQLSKLKLLELFNNRLTEIPREIGQLSNLKFLHLFNNRLTELPRHLAGLGNLTYVNLEGNDELGDLAKRYDGRYAVEELFDRLLKKYPPGKKTKFAGFKI